MCACVDGTTVGDVAPWVRAAELLLEVEHRSSHTVRTVLHADVADLPVGVAVLHEDAKLGAHHNRGGVVGVDDHIVTRNVVEVDEAQTIRTVARPNVGPCDVVAEGVERLAHLACTVGAVAADRDDHVVGVVGIHTQASHSSTRAAQDVGHFQGIDIFLAVHVAQAGHTRDLAVPPCVEHHIACFVSLLHKFDGLGARESSRCFCDANP